MASGERTASHLWGHWEPALRVLLPGRTARCLKVRDSRSLWLRCEVCDGIELSQIPVRLSCLHTVSACSQEGPLKPEVGHILTLPKPSTGPRLSRGQSPRPPGLLAPLGLCVAHRLSLLLAWSPSLAQSLVPLPECQLLSVAFPELPTEKGSAPHPGSPPARHVPLQHSRPGVCCAHLTPHLACSAGADSALQTLHHLCQSHSSETPEVRTGPGILWALSKRVSASTRNHPPSSQPRTHEPTSQDKLRGRLGDGAQDTLTVVFPNTPDTYGKRPWAGFSSCHSAARV